MSAPRLQASHQAPLVDGATSHAVEDLLLVGILSKHSVKPAQRNTGPASSQHTSQGLTNRAPAPPVLHTSKQCGVLPDQSSRHTRTTRPVACTCASPERIHLSFVIDVACCLRPRYSERDGRNALFCLAHLVALPHAEPVVKEREFTCLDSVAGATTGNNAHNCTTHCSCFLRRANASVYLNSMLHHCEHSSKMNSRLEFQNGHQGKFPKTCPPCFQHDFYRSLSS